MMEYDGICTDNEWLKFIVKVGRHSIIRGAFENRFQCIVFPCICSLSCCRFDCLRRLTCSQDVVLLRGNLKIIILLNQESCKSLDTPPKGLGTTIGVAFNSTRRGGYVCYILFGVSLCLCGRVVRFGRGVSFCCTGLKDMKDILNVCF